MHSIQTRTITTSHRQRPGHDCPARSWWARGLLLAILAVGPAGAVHRVLTIAAPVLAAAGSKLSISVFASTNAGGGEQIGFFHGEYSTDGGKTWTGFCYAENVGTAATRIARFTTGDSGSTVLVRVRIAFRGGAAGDVDFNGATISWADTWTNWREPPAKVATTTVIAP